jgi:V/A-type H+-transporting ATPase subunit E
MEELRSTAVLDREIQDDARRKADKILKICESDCQKMAEDVSVRLSVIAADKEAEYKKRLASYIKDSESAIPLEKQRRLVTHIDSSVRNALDGWLSAIGEPKRLFLLSILLQKYKPFIRDKKIAVEYIGHSAEAVRKTVSDIFGDGNIETMTELTAQQAAAAGFFDGMLITAADNSIICRATLGEIRDDLLSDKRQEMAEALFGGRLPE